MKMGVRIAFSLALVVTLCLAGCVERELYLKTEPPGAAVALDGLDRGVTPITIPFDYYGDRHVELRLKGYRVKREVVCISAPWYQIFPLDFFFELLWPGTMKDTHEVAYTLEPWKPENLEDEPAVLKRAEALRFSTILDEEGEK